MSSNHSKACANYLPAYQIPGVPYVTSSVALEVKGPGAANEPIKVSFPFVTNFITVRNTGASELRLAFTFSGSYGPGETQVGGGGAIQHHGPHASRRNYFLIPTGSGGSDSNGNSQSTQTFNVRCKELFFQSDTSTATSFSLLAGLTTVNRNAFPVLSGSNGFEGIG